MPWPQTETESAAVHSVLDKVLGDVELLEEEEKLLRERLDELTQQKAEAEATASYLRRRLAAHPAPRTESEGALPSASVQTPAEPQAGPGPSSPIKTPRPAPQASHTVSAPRPKREQPARQHTIDIPSPSDIPRSPIGRTRYELARTLLATSEYGLTSTELAQVFDGTRTPTRSRVEGARLTLSQLATEGLAERVDRNRFIAKRDHPSAPIAPS